MIAITRTHLHAGAAPFVLALAIMAGPAFAQATAPADNAAPPADEQVIVVTGSRIARPELKASVPIAVVSAQSITDAGQTNLLDALRDLPVSGQSLGRTASNFQNSGNGTATVNLRNLGSARTLVLINGRRTVGIPGSSAVDLNNIPTDLIDHVEIATGGTSAVYGSDAVAGVVNIILKNNFKGFEIHGQNSISSRGDGYSGLISATGGTEFAGGAGHIVANVTYTKDDAVPSSARDYSRNDSPGGSAYTPAGRFTDANGNDWTFDANNNVVPWAGTPAQRFNRASERLLAVPVERFSASLLAH